MSSFNFKGIADKVNKLDGKQDFNLQNIDIEKIIPSEKNFYGMRDIEELAEDIKTNGLYHNLVVVPYEDRYKILSGERRYRALKILGYKKVPCQVRENLNEVDSEIMLIQANAKTRELTNSEKMKQVQRLDELYKEKRRNGEKLEGKTRDLIGKDLGLSGGQVGKYQKINKDLIPELKQMLENNNLDMEKASSIASLDEIGQMSVYDILKGHVELSRDEVNKLKKALKEKEDRSKEEREKYSKELKAEYLKMKKDREEFNAECEKLRLENEALKEVKKEENIKVETQKVEEIPKEIEGARSEHLDMGNIEFNAEMSMTIRNLKDATSLLVRKLMSAKEDKKVLNDRNIKDIEDLQKNYLKYVFNFRN
jgi:ParB family chromosome partitioning protein